jgi:poly(A) polymerase
MCTSEFLFFLLISSDKREKSVSSCKMAPRQEKVHTSALCWIPPEGDGYEAIQSIRRMHDRQIKRWPPHINLLYPFVPSEDFEDAAEKLADALKGIEAFDVSLEEIDHFSHGRRSCTAWLRPSETHEFVALQAACQAAFPHCDDQSKRGAFVPHLSVGQCKDRAAVRALTSAVAWRPVTFHCGEVCLISRQGQDDPFEMHWRVRLGTGSFAPGPGGSAAAKDEDAAAAAAAVSS